MNLLEEALFFLQVVASLFFKIIIFFESCGFFIFIFLFWLLYFLLSSFKRR